MPIQISAKDQQIRAKAAKAAKASGQPVAAKAASQTASQTAAEAARGSQTAKSGDKGQCQRRVGRGSHQCSNPWNFNIQTASGSRGSCHTHLNWWLAASPAKRASARWVAAKVVTAYPAHLWMGPAAVAKAAAEAAAAEADKRASSRARVKSQQGQPQVPTEAEAAASQPDSQPAEAMALEGHPRGSGSQPDSQP